MPHPLVSVADIETYQRDGVVLVRGLFAAQVDTICAGIEHNMAEPGSLRRGKPEARRERPLLRRLLQLDPYCGIRGGDPAESPAAEVAADLMESTSAQIFPRPCAGQGTRHGEADAVASGLAPTISSKAEQTVSFWSPMDPVSEATLRCVAGSHDGSSDVLPTRWLSEENFYPDASAYMPVPDPDAEGMRVVEYAMQPGDAVAFDFRTLHGARRNESASRRRAFSLRLVGDDARYVERPGRTSPPFPGHGMTPGEKLREDWFPVIFPRDLPEA